jgi:hypothetical protein
MATLAIHVVAGVLSALSAVGDPFAFLAPQVVLTAADRRHLAEGEIVARMLDAADGQISSFSILRIDVPPGALPAATRNIEDLKRSRFVTAIKRFSNPPVLSDLDELKLGPRDLAAAAACRPGNCSLKLTAGEIELLNGAGSEPDRDEALQRAFRKGVLSRVNAYLEKGLAGLPPAANRSTATCFDEVFKQLASASPSLQHAPCASRWLHDFPNNGDHVESFLYWSQETYGAGKPVVLVTHVGIVSPVTPGDPVIVLSKQVMATHYMTGGLSMMAMTTDEVTGTTYLVYLNRIGVDLLGGFFGPVRRAALESRLKRELPEIMQKLRVRLERTAAVPTRESFPQR